MVALKARDVRPGQLAGEVGVLPVRLAVPAPPGVPHQVDVGAEAVQQPAPLPNAAQQSHFHWLTPPQSVARRGVGCRGAKPFRMIPTVTSHEGWSVQ